MMKSRLGESAIWAVDPFTKDLRPLRQARLAIGAWEKSQALDVRPVSVLSPPSDLVLDGNLGAWREAYAEWSGKTLGPLLRGLPKGKVKEPAVLMRPAMWRGESIDELIAYAKKSRARLIVAATHVKKGMGLSRLGGFTQALIERSPIPVLTVRPNARVPRTFSRILYMTDFSAGSKKSFLKLLDIAEVFGSKLTIFHHLQSPEIPMAEYPLPMTMPGDYLSSVIVANEMRWREVADAWKALAEKRGLETEIILAKDFLALSESVGRAARKSKADLIALSLQPHPVTRILLGSTASEIVQSASLPVLVFPETKSGASRRKGRELHS